jgi:RNA polymerase sigma-70 factor, ECF subfamily
MGDRTIIPDPSDPIDCAVLEFQRGIRREENFERIVKRYYRPVQALLSKRCFSTDDCLDLNQETFLKVYTGLDGYAWKSKFSSWLFTVAVNVCRNWHGGEWRRERLVPKNPAAGDPPAASGEERERVAVDTNESPLGELLSEERYELLHEAVDQLPPQKRECVKLRLLDRSYQEIADAMELSIGTVKAHLNQARESLRTMLSDDFDDIDF